MLTTLLAGLIAINTLGGCASETLADNSKSDIIEETKDEQEIQADVIEMSMEEPVMYKDPASMDMKLIRQEAKVTSIDLSNDPIYKRAVIIVNESSLSDKSDKSVKRVYNQLKLANSEDFNDIKGNYLLDDYVFVDSMAYKVVIEEEYKFNNHFGVIKEFPSKATILVPLTEEEALIFLEEYDYINNDVIRLINTL